MQRYTVLIHKDTHRKTQQYIDSLRSGGSAGRYVRQRLVPLDIHTMTVDVMIDVLLNTKSPTIFAESAVIGDGTDWTPDELSILGDIGIAAPVTVYDDGQHHAPTVHREPFTATLLFVPGALLQGMQGATPADWDEIVRDGAFCFEAFSALYTRRLYPLFAHANQQARLHGRQAFLTIPGLGCGCFAGPFRGYLGEALKQALVNFLEQHGRDFPHIRGVYYDPYSECENETHKIHHIDFFVRPYTEGNTTPQLCHPETYGEGYRDHELFSIVAWDHVSWPGNDFYSGARATDDGVKAAATDSMAVMTGVKGRYDTQRNHYAPPSQYRTWGDVITRTHITLTSGDGPHVYG